MVKALTLVVGLFLTCPIGAYAQQEPPLDVVAQKVLGEYGVDSEILKPYSRVDETSSRKDGRFLFNFTGSPGIEVLLDRNYWALGTRSAKDDNGIVGYMFNPKDEQSALNISVGHHLLKKSDDSSIKAPGFSGFTIGKGMVGSQKIMWRRWSDDNHLHSDCTISVPSPDGGDQPGYELNITVVANSEERRKALENCMETFRLLPSKK